uniref:Uncharacterized protein n=1 Tax=Arundo donax TaxID=35708 RepID=A0A0A8XR94_ARUDO
MPFHLPVNFPSVHDELKAVLFFRTFGSTSAITHNMRLHRQMKRHSEQYSPS